MSMQNLKGRAFAMLVRTVRVFGNRGLTRVPGAAALRNLLFRQLTPSSRITVRLEGFSIHLNPKDTGLTRHLLASKSYENLETSLFLEALSPGMVLVDVGANIGYYVLLAACTKGGVTVYAFEPEPATFAHLQDNLQLNGLRQVTAVNMALSAEPGKLDFYVHESNLGKHSVLPEEGGTRVTVPATTLDTFVAERGLDRLDLLKLDVEGAEALVIKGGLKAIARFKPVIFIEYTPEWLRKAGCDPDEMLRGLEGLGYSISLVDDRSNTLQPMDRTALHALEASTRWTFQANLILRAR
jgi:FkbM family methyltransferase